MRTILVVLFTLALADLAHAQTPPPSPNSLAARQVQLERLKVLVERLGPSESFMRSMLVYQAQVALDATIKAEKTTLLAPDTLRVENVTIWFSNGAVLTADDAVINNGEVRVGQNARMKIAPQ